MSSSFPHRYQIIDADRVTLFIVDAVQKDLFCKVSKDAQGFRVPMGVGIAGTVAQSGIGINIPDAYKDARWGGQSFDKQTGYHTKSILCIPIKNKANGEVVAVLQCINKGGGVPFDEYDESMMQEFSDEVGVVLARRALESAYHSVLSVDDESASDKALKDKSMLSMYTSKAVGGKKAKKPMERGRKRLSNMERKSLIVGGDSRGSIDMMVRKRERERERETERKDRERKRQGEKEYMCSLYVFVQGVQVVCTN